MRLLSDNPSMDFLRREAKDLLVVLRESDATATLSHAQQALAAEYGYRAWNDLKAEVEQRREAPPVAPDGLADGLSEAFGLGAVSAITPIRYEYMGRRWCLETERGRVVACPVFDWICDDTAAVAVDLMERARSAGVLSPVAVRTPDGGLVRRVLDQNWRVDEWIDLGPTPGLPLQTSVARRLGEILAAVHSVAPTTDQSVTGAWVADRPSTDSWGTLLENARAANKSWADEFAALSRSVEELSAITAPTNPRDVVISNRDIQPSVIHFGPGDELVVTHWDFAGPVSKEQELATLLAQTALHAHDAARALMDGYRARAGDDTPTLTLSSFAGYITGWLTWANHRACDAIAAQDSTEQADFAERSLREALDDPLTAAQLRSLVVAVSKSGGDGT